MVIEGVVCHIINNKRLLLIRKSAELFGGGKWNAVGGKMHTGESPEQACIREVREESGLLVSNLKYHGVLRFWFGHKGEPDWVVHAFSTSSIQGQLKESAEGALRWIEFDKIPYEEMWEDDKHWLPLLIDGKTFNGEFCFNEEGTKLLKHKLKVRNSFPLRERPQE